MFGVVVNQENYQEDSDRDDGFFKEFDFVKNQKLFDFVRAEQIGSLKDYLTQTTAQQSSADGKGISEAIVGLEAQLVVTTRNKKCQQRYDNNDCVTLEISNRQGENCAAEVQVQDNTGAPNDQFVVKCIIIPPLMKINVIKASSRVFQ